LNPTSEPKTTSTLAWAQVNHILVFKITHQVDINFPVGSSSGRA
jgi:hypothetical protein